MRLFTVKSSPNRMPCHLGLVCSPVVVLIGVLWGVKPYIVSES